MKLHVYPVLLLASIFIFLNNICGAEDLPADNIVAKYANDHSITISELNQYIKDWLYYKKYENRSDIVNHALTDMLTNQLKRIDFFEKGLDKNKKLLQGISRIISDELVSEYYETQYVGKYTNEEYARKIYGLMDKEVIYRSIALNKPDSASQKLLDSLKEKAMAIKTEADKGKDFGLLVKEYSQDKTSLMNDGYMPTVDWKKSLSDPVGNIIFHLNNNDVFVINSEKAFLVVKVTSVNKINLAPFDSLKTKIISDLRTGYSDAVDAEYDKDKKALIDTNSLKWNEKALKQLVQWSNIPDFYKNGKYQKTFKDALEKGNNKVILNYNNHGSLDYKEYQWLLDNVLIMGNTDSIKTEDNIKDFILEAIRTDMIVKKADSLNLLKKIFNPYTDDTVLKNQIVYLYNQVEIESKIPEATDDALHKFYKENENSLYYQLEKRNLFVMVFSTMADAENALAKISSGTPFEKATGSYLVKTYIKERNGEIKSFFLKEKPTFGKAAFEMKQSEVSKPIKFVDENNQTKYAILKCYNIRPEKQLTFDDVKKSITEDYKSHYRDEIEKEIKERLTSKYHPVINEDVLAKLIAAE